MSNLEKKSTYILHYMIRITLISIHIIILICLLYILSIIITAVFFLLQRKPQIIPFYICIYNLYTKDVLRHVPYIYICLSNVGVIYSVKLRLRVFYIQLGRFIANIWNWLIIGRPIKEIIIKYLIHIYTCIYVYTYKCMYQRNELLHFKKYIFNEYINIYC